MQSNVLNRVRRYDIKIRWCRFRGCESEVVQSRLWKFTFMDQKHYLQVQCISSTSSIYILAFVGGGLKIEVCVMLATIFPSLSHKAPSEYVLAARAANVFHSLRCHSLRSKSGVSSLKAKSNVEHAPAASSGRLSRVSGRNEIDASIMKARQYAC